MVQMQYLHCKEIWSEIMCHSAFDFLLTGQFFRKYSELLRITQSNHKSHFWNTSD